MLSLREKQLQDILDDDKNINKRVFDTERLQITRYQDIVTPPTLLDKKVSFEIQQSIDKINQLISNTIGNLQNYNDEYDAAFPPSPVADELSSPVASDHEENYEEESERKSEITDLIDRKTPETDSKTYSNTKSNSVNIKDEKLFRKTFALLPVNINSIINIWNQSMINIDIYSNKHVLSQKDLMFIDEKFKTLLPPLNELIVQIDTIKSTNNVAITPSDDKIINNVIRSNEFKLLKEMYDKINIGDYSQLAYTQYERNNGETIKSRFDAKNALLNEIKKLSPEDLYKLGKTESTLNKLLGPSQAKSYIDKINKYINDGSMSPSTHSSLIDSLLTAVDDVGDLNDLDDFSEIGNSSSDDDEYGAFGQFNDSGDSSSDDSSGYGYDDNVAIAEANNVAVADVEELNAEIDAEAKDRAEADFATFADIDNDELLERLYKYDRDTTKAALKIEELEKELEYIKIKQPDRSDLITDLKNQIAIANVDYRLNSVTRYYLVQFIRNRGSDNLKRLALGDRNLDHLERRVVEQEHKDDQVVEQEHKDDLIDQLQASRMKLRKILENLTELEDHGFDDRSTEVVRLRSEFMEEERNFDRIHGQIMDSQNVARQEGQEGQEVEVVSDDSDESNESKVESKYVKINRAKTNILMEQRNRLEEYIDYLRSDGREDSSEYRDTEQQLRDLDLKLDQLRENALSIQELKDILQQLNYDLNELKKLPSSEAKLIEMGKNKKQRDEIMYILENLDSKDITEGNREGYKRRQSGKGKRGRGRPRKNLMARKMLEINDDSNENYILM